MAAVRIWNGGPCKRYRSKDLHTRHAVHKHKAYVCNTPFDHVCFGQCVHSHTQTRVRNVRLHSHLLGKDHCYRTTRRSQNIHIYIKASTHDTMYCVYMPLVPVINFTAYACL